MRTKTWQRSAIVLALGCFLLLLCMAGYGEKVELSWWVEYTEPATQQAITNTILEPFHQTYPDIRINMDPKAGTTDYLRILNTALAAGAGPDILDIFGPAHAMALAKEQIILSLTPYSKKYGWDKRFFKGALGTSVYKGDLYTIPVMYEALVLWFNVDMFVKYGWRIPTNWDDLESICRQIQGQGIIPIIHGGANCQICTGEWWYSYTLNAYAGPENVYKALIGEKPWTDQIFVEAFEKIKYIWQQGWISEKKDRELTTSDAWGMFADQRAAMKMEGTWAFQFVDEEVKDFTWATTILPSWREGVESNYPMGIGSNIGINAKTEYADEAATFLDFISKDPKRVGRMIAAVKGEFWVPVPLSMDDFPAGVDSRLKRMFAALTEAQTKGDYGYVAWTYWPPKTNTYLWQNFASIQDGSLAIPEYLEEANRLFREEMKEEVVPAVAAR